MEKLKYELNPAPVGNDFKLNRGGYCFFGNFFNRNAKRDTVYEFSSYITQGTRPILKATKP